MGQRLDPGTFDSIALDLLPAQVALVDGQATIVAVNRAWKRGAELRAEAGGGIAPHTGVGANYLEACRSRGADPSARQAAEGIAAVVDGSHEHFQLEYACAGPSETRWFSMSVTRREPPGSGALIAHFDITEHYRATLALRAQNRVLERIATGSEVEHLLEGVVQQVEEQLLGSMCSILLREGEHLVLGAGPSLPAAYNAGLGRVPIGPNVGCCGTAAFRRETVIVADIEQDPLWVDFRGLARANGLRSCWSIPIFASLEPREVLGTFAIYHRQARVPGPTELAALHSAAHLARVAIERHRAQSLLSESEERLRLLFESIVDYAMFMTDPFGRIIMWSLPAERIYGYTQHEAIGLPVAALDPPAANPGAPSRTEFSPANRRELQGWQLRRDGRPFWASVVTTEVRHPDGSLRGLAKVVRDLTELHRLEDQLRQAQKLEAVGQLAAGVAHDFNNLLTVIRGNGEFLLAQLEPASHGHEALLAICSAGDRAAALTRQLLTFGRQQALEAVVLDLNGVVERTEKLLHRAIGEHITLRLSLDPQLLAIKADPAQLEQVLLNLAVNARDALPRGGELRFETRNLLQAQTAPAAGLAHTPRACVELRVTDNGQGMDEATRLRIFEPFFTTKSPGLGTGLGLSVVYGAVQQCGGEILVESRPGVGTTFVLRFPALTGALPTEPHKPVPASPLGRELLLVVEDEPAVSALLQTALRAQGFEVLEAGSGARALELASDPALPIELLITDYRMPGINGRQLADQLHLTRPTLPVLFISGYVGDEHLRAGLLRDREAFLPKPFELAALVSMVRALLARAARS